MTYIDVSAGRTFLIHGVKHILLAQRGADLLMLQLVDNGDPRQYIVAHDICLDDGELSWVSANCFPLYMYPDTAAALKDAIVTLMGDDKNALS